MVISPKDIRARAERLYPRYLAALTAEADFFPCELSFRKVKATDAFDVVRQCIDALVAGSRDVTGRGYSVAFEEVNTRRYGIQRYPTRISFETEPDFLNFLGKSEEVGRLRSDLSLIGGELPTLNAWARQNIRQVVTYAGRWENLLAVCQYFLHHPRPNLYARQLPLELHTKFVEEHQGILSELLNAILPEDAIDASGRRFEDRYFLRYDEPLVRLRFLDSQLQLRLGLPVSDLSVPASSGDRLELVGATCLVTENKMTFLTLPPISEGIGVR